MNPDYQPEQSPYDFIMNQNKSAPKKPLNLVDPSSKNGFLLKIGFIVGGVVLFMIITAIGVNLLTSSKTNTTDIVSLAETQAELVRVTGTLAAGQANDQTVKNVATNTALTLSTQQQKTVAFLATKGVKLTTKQLALKKDSTTDTQLQAATASSTFDTVFTQLLRKQLSSYTDDLQTYYKNATNTTVKTLLQQDYAQAQLLEAQIPNAAQ
ncbi:MAG: hypothetical protein ACQR33_04125 [Candidatus Saccharibacteria bacterium]